MALEKSPSLSLELASVRTVLSTLGSPGSQGESPASTYGGTMTTSSISPTPRGDNSEGKSFDLLSRFSPQSSPTLVRSSHGRPSG
jgi:hypothetical protein